MITLKRAILLADGENKNMKHIISLMPKSLEDIRLTECNCGREMTQKGHDGHVEAMHLGRREDDGIYVTNDTDKDYTSTSNGEDVWRDG